ncbi:hypothetical protein [Alteromonas macleodii]|uniref:hypothetical protein n=1 Tax=Alteromonas macleodii TaxID=28108 RepID=UPI0020767817|nr:hypothetical protein [Alteromonas macleodii]USI27915.1 hypothetical protein NFG60_19765 [Alteromonas macleodii]
MSFELVVTWLSIASALIAIAGAIYSLKKKFFRKNDATPPIIYTERKHKLVITANGEATSTVSFNVKLNQDVSTLEWTSSVDNSNCYPYDTPSLKAFVDEIDVSENLVVLRRTASVLKFQLLIPASARRKMAFELRYVFGFGKKYPASLKELAKIRKLNPDIKKGFYISEGQFVDIPTKRLRSEIEFKQGYPLDNLTAFELINSSKDDRLLTNDDRHTFDIDRDKSTKAFIDVKEPIQGHRYCFRWALDK